MTDIPQAVESDHLAGEVVARHLLASVFLEEKRLERAEPDRVQRCKAIASAVQRGLALDACARADELVETAERGGVEPKRKAQAAKRARGATRADVVKGDDAAREFRRVRLRNDEPTRATCR